MSKKVKDAGVYFAIISFSKVSKNHVDTEIVSELIIADCEKDAIDILATSESDAITSLVMNGYVVTVKYAKKIKSSDITELWDCCDTPEPDEERYTHAELMERMPCAKKDQPTNN